MKNKTKEELLKIIEQLQDKIDEYNEMEEQADDLKGRLEDMESNSSIKDLDNFKFELSKNGLDSTELLTFINDYVNFYN